MNPIGLILKLTSEQIYFNISDLNISFLDYEVCLFTCEITNLGFISDLCEFPAKLSISAVSHFVYTQLVRFVIANSYHIY